MVTMIKCLICLLPKNVEFNFQKGDYLFFKQWFVVTNSKTKTTGGEWLEVWYDKDVREHHRLTVDWARMDLSNKIKSVMSYILYHIIYTSSPVVHSGLFYRHFNQILVSGLKMYGLAKSVWSTKLHIVSH